MARNAHFVLALLLQVLLLDVPVSAFRFAWTGKPIVRDLSNTALNAKDNKIAAGTPFERPKIGDSIVDLIGGTPMVSSSTYLASATLRNGEMICIHRSA